MPSVETHLQQAVRNRDFSNNLDLTQDAHVQWAIVSSFYAALHFVEALFAVDSVHSLNHMNRNQNMAQYSQGDAEYHQLRLRYDRLRRFSEDVRYRCIIFSASDYQRKVQPLLNQIEAEVGNRLPLEEEASMGEGEDDE